MLLTITGFLMMALFEKNKGIASAISRLGICFTPLITAYLGQNIMNPESQKILTTSDTDIIT